MKTDNLNNIIQEELYNILSEQFTNKLGIPAGYDPADPLRPISQLVGPKYEPRPIKIEPITSATPRMPEKGDIVVPGKAYIRNITVDVPETTVSYTTEIDMGDESCPDPPCMHAVGYEDIVPARTVNIPEDILAQFKDAGGNLEDLNRAMWERENVGKQRKARLAGNYSEKIRSDKEMTGLEQMYADLRRNPEKLAGDVLMPSGAGAGSVVAASGITIPGKLSKASKANTLHNLKVLRDVQVKTKAGPKFYMETAAERFGLGDDILDAVVDEIPDLKINKIKKFLGAGDNGIAYELEDGTVFKIFEARSDYDLNWFKRAQERRSPTDITVHEFGDIGHIKPGLKWVKMEKITPITDLIPAGNQLDVDVQEMNNFLSKFLSEKTRQFYRDPEFAGSPVVQLIKQFDNAQDQIAWLQKHAPKSQAISPEHHNKLIEDLYFFFKENPEVLGDVHSGNIGLNPKTGKFQVFDVSRGKRDDLFEESQIKTLQKIIKEERYKYLQERQKDVLRIDVVLRYEKDFAFYGNVLNQIKAIKGITVAKADERGVVDIYPDKQQLILHLKFIPDRPILQYANYLKNEFKHIRDSNGERILSVRLVGFPKKVS